MEELVTILVPNYRTLQLTKLCLRLLRQHTDLTKAKVMVIDNDSNDESLDYLKSLKWITLLQRKPEAGETGALSHSKALDLALDQVNTPFILSIHTDTLVKNSRWLPFLLSNIEKDENIAGIGSWKLEFKPFYKRIFKKIERNYQRFYYYLTKKNNHNLEGIGKNYYYLRSHCALYRTGLLRKYRLHFADGNMVAGKYLHHVLQQAGYQLLFLPSEELSQYVEHVNHATTILNPELSARGKNLKTGLKRIEKSLKRMNADAIFEADYLDE